MFNSLDSTFNLIIRCIQQKQNAGFLQTFVDFPEFPNKFHMSLKKCFLESGRKKIARQTQKKYVKYCRRLRRMRKNDVLGCVSAKINHFVGVYK